MSLLSKVNAAPGVTWILTSFNVTNQILLFCLCLKFFRGLPLLLGSISKPVGSRACLPSSLIPLPTLWSFLLWGLCLEHSIPPPLRPTAPRAHTHLYLFNPELGCIPSAAQCLALGKHSVIIL